MGKRRIRNFLKLHYSNIIGFDISKKKRLEASNLYHIQTVSKIRQALIKKPDIMIICTPPNLHYKYAEMAMEKNIHFFTEVNLFSKDVKKIINKLRNKSILGVPSCTLLYNPIVKELKKIIEKKTIGKILMVYHHFGHYLPNWHPWEDYRKIYFSKRETGGAREVVPFELVWLNYLFSEIKSVYGSIHKTSKLDVDIDDLYQIMIEFKNGIQCILVIDVISEPAFNETKIIGEKGTIFCDHNKALIKINTLRERKTLKFRMGTIERGYKGNTSAESLYVEEIKNFIDAIKQKRNYPYTFNDEFKTLQVLDLIETSNKKTKKIIIK